MAGTPEYELLNKNLEVVEGHAVKAPEDYQDPEQLYQSLVERIKKYHPSADITMIEKAYCMGTLISGCPNCAIIDLSSNCTIE